MCYKMNTDNKCIVYLMLVMAFMILEITAQGFYKAAVVEYAPKEDLEQLSNRIMGNVESYKYYMEAAADKGAHIIVFPEDGLSGLKDINPNTVDELSTEVPDPNSGLSPCRTPANYSEYLGHLSCAAATYSIYTVVNLIEKSTDNTSKKIYFNTNVVLDNFGVVVARYRKINVFEESIFAPGKEVVTFKTHFGPTFAMFTGFDIVHKKPALDAVTNSSITDVIYSAAWYSMLPFYGALSVQHGYAKSNGVNLIASVLNNPSENNGGSGIYLADGRIAEIYVKGVKGNKLIIQDVPTVLPDSTTARDTCGVQNGAVQRGITFPGLPGGILSDISSFATAQENLVNYTVKALSLNQSIVTETICSESSNFCCIFEITLLRNDSVPLNYFYKLVAYYGVSEVTNNQTIGVSNCALVACTNESNSSCGGRHKEAPQGVIFESISVKGTFNPKTTHPQPTTITHKLVPITEYAYCKREVNGELEIEMRTTGVQKDLLTFGINGRVFTNDDKPAGRINSASSFTTDMYLTLAISIVIFLLQD